MRQKRLQQNQIDILIVIDQMYENVAIWLNVLQRIQLVGKHNKMFLSEYVYTIHMFIFHAFGG